MTVRPGLSVVLALACVIAGCAPASKTVARDLPPLTIVRSAADGEVTVRVLELFCQSCASQIISGCRHISGVAAVDVDRREKLLTLHFDTSLTTRERVLAAVDDVVASIP